VQQGTVPFFIVEKVSGSALREDLPDEAIIR
jgi:hypothetical protein